MLGKDPGSILLMKLAPRLGKFVFIAVPLLLIAFGVAVYLWISGDAERAIERERAALERERARGIPAVKHEGRLDAPAPEGWRVLLSIRNARDLALFEGRLHLATDGGILAFEPSGAPAAHYTHFNGLPDNRVSSLAVRGDSLFAGTSAGLARLRAGGITTWTFAEGGADVTALLDGRDGLYIGTRGNGLLRFDGTSFQRISESYSGGGFDHVTCLADWNGQVVAGTWANGIYLLQGAAWKHLGVRDGLTNDHVTSLAPATELLVATAGGLCRVDGELRPRRIEPPMVASAILRQGTAVYAGSMDGILHLTENNRRRPIHSFGDKSDPRTVNRLVQVDGRTWALTTAGLFTISGDHVLPFATELPETLSSSFIAALALDGGGNLWVGYFDAGVEVLSPGLASVRRHTEPECRTVKSLFWDGQEGSIWLGSSKGLVRFRRDQRRDVWTRDDGLINNEVNAVQRLDNRSIAIATGGGISLLENGRFRSLYAFHGLVNNRVFALQTLPGGNEGQPLLAAGTLGGISLVQAGRVTGSITPENSRLPIHWITALAAWDGGLLIGTYGGGIAWRGTDGSWLEMPGELRALEINPNALLVSGDLVLAGTLDRGIALLRRGDARWQVRRERLCSPNVTALAEDASRYYIGTDNGLLVVQKGNL